MKYLKRFVDQLNFEIDKNNLKYDAGRVFLHNGHYIIDRAQKGAEETFSVGQPVYNDNGDLLGYLCIGLFQNLNYGNQIRIPVENWEISLPTKECRSGVHVKTYWQKERDADETLAMENR